MAGRAFAVDLDRAEAQEDKSGKKERLNDRPKGNRIGEIKDKILTLKAIKNIESACHMALNEKYKRLIISEDDLQKSEILKSEGFEPIRSGTLSSTPLTYSLTHTNSLTHPLKMQSGKALTNRSTTGKFG